jgi:hypothetical protein
LPEFAFIHREIRRARNVIGAIGFISPIHFIMMEIAPLSLSGTVMPESCLDLKQEDCATFERIVIRLGKRPSLISQCRFFALFLP